MLNLTDVDFYIENVNISAGIIYYIIKNLHLQ